MKIDKSKGKAPEKVLKGEDFRPSDAEINPGGRPSEYTEKLASIILMRMSCGESVRSIARDDTMPAYSTIWLWRMKHPEFSNQYLRAREEGADPIADECFDIIDDGQNDWMEKFGKDGESLGWTLNGESIQRSRARVDFRKWYLGKIKKDTYGDKLETTVVDPYKDMTREEILNELEERRAKRLKESEA